MVRQGSSKFTAVDHFPLTSGDNFNEITTYATGAILLLWHKFQFIKEEKEEKIKEETQVEGRDGREPAIPDEMCR